jgi:hypothetical protein
MLVCVLGTLGACGSIVKDDADDGVGTDPSSTATGSSSTSTSDSTSSDAEGATPVWSARPGFA